jgi:hydrogenase expression/formation protein HypC
MCLGEIARVVTVPEPRVGVLDSGAVVSLAFVPEARAGDHVLVHLGIPVEIVDPQEAPDEHA